MILKTKSPQSAQSPQAAAGLKQEQNVAFFLRRAYKDHQQVLVINDFKFRFNDEVAQIDHLIVYSYGFVLIESKSIRGHVKVNQQGEWTRSLSTYQSKSSKWQGMPSPIKQVELQQALLKELLSHNRSEILEKMFGLTQGFGGRCWDHLCAVSSDAVIDRKSMPKAVSDKLIKSEFLVEKLDKIMNLKGKYLRLAYLADTRPFFNQQELESIGSFLIKQHIVTKVTTAPAAIDPSQPIQQPVTTVQSLALESIATATSQITLSCKNCGESNNYQPMYGKFGYYIKCSQCTKNTPMKQACPQCKSKQTRVQKSQETYTLNCQECSFSQQIV